MNDDPDVLMCARKKDVLHNLLPGSIEGACSKCSAAVSIAPAGQEFLKGDPSVVVMCVECTEPLITKDKLPLALAPGVLRDLAMAAAWMRRN